MPPVGASSRSVPTVPGELGYDTGPFVVLAVFCEQAIEEKSGVLTLIRIIDQVTIQAIGPDAPDDLPVGSAVSTTLVVGLKAGMARGKQKVQATFVHPDGTRHPGPEIPIHFNAGDHQGSNLLLKATVALSTTGIYWAEVAVNERMVSKTPLEIRYEVNPPQVQAGS
jgi:hypothetical protein